MADQKIDILLQIRAELDGIKAAQRETQSFKNQLKQGFALGVGIEGFDTIKRFFELVKDGVAQGIDFNAVIEQQTVAFRTLLGSVEEADERIRDLIDFAAKTPFEIREIVEANKVLQSLSNGTLATADGMRIVGDAASAVGRDFREVGMWIGRLYAGLESGTPVGEATLRLIEMGLISGDTSRELQALSKEGRSTGEAFDIIRRTFDRTAGAMELQSQTFNGLKSTLADTINQLLGSATKPVFDALKATLVDILQLLGAIPRETEKMLQDIAAATDQSRSDLQGLLPETQENVESKIRDEIEKLSEGIKERESQIKELEALLKDAFTINITAGEDDPTVNIGKTENAIRDLRSELTFFKKQLLAKADLLQAFDPDGNAEEKIAALTALLEKLNSQKEKFRVTDSVSSRIVSKEEADEAREDEVVLFLGNDKQILSQIDFIEQRIEDLKNAGKAPEIAEENQKAKEEEERLERRNKLIAESNSYLEKNASILAKAEDSLSKASSTDIERLESVKGKLSELNKEQEKEIDLIERIVTGKDRELVRQAVADRYRLESIPLLIEESKLKEKISKDEAKNSERAVELKAAELRRQLDQIDHLKTIVSLEDDSADKKAKLKSLLVDEQKAIIDLIQLWVAYSETVTDPAVQEAIKNKVQGLVQQGERSGQTADEPTRLEQSESEFAALEDPAEHFQNAGDAAIASLLDYQVQLGTIYDQMYDQITRIQEELTGSIAESIEGLIKGTMSWSEAFESVGSAILNSVITAFAQMLASWITTQLTMLALNKIFGKANQQSTQSEASSAAASWAPAAISASVASYGTAALVGTAAYIAALGLGTGLAAAFSSVGGFAEGGYTGQGGKYDVAGLVHAGEFVTPADVVSKAGGPQYFYDQMSSIRGGGKEDPSSGSSSGMGTMIVVDNRKDAERYLESAEGEARIIDIMEYNKGRLI